MNINTRVDLDAIAGTADHAAFLSYLVGTLTYRSDITVYPPQYDHTLQPGAPGYVAPNCQDIKDLSVITRFGFTKDQLLAAAGGAGT
jgi:hypothetical protein